MNRSSMYLLAAPLVLLLAAGSASAQRGHPGGGHPGGGHPGAGHPGGYYGGGAYHGGYYGNHRPGGHYGGYGYGYGGIVIGIELGSSYYGQPFIGGPGYPYGYGAYGVPVYPGVVGVPPSVALTPVPASANESAGFVRATTGQPAPATVTVLFAPKAQLWFNGKEQPAGQGQFVTDAIQPGQTAMLEVQTRLNGSTSTMQLRLQAGDKMTVDLSRQ